MFRKCVKFYNITKQLNKKLKWNYQEKINKLKETDILELMYLVRPEWKIFIIAGICHGVSSGILMLLPRVIPEFGNLYSEKKQKVQESDDEQTKQEKTDKNSQIDQKYWKFIKYWGQLCILSGIFTFSRRYLNGDLGNRIAFRMRNKIYQNLLNRDVKYFYRKNINSSNFVHKLSNDVSAVGQSLSNDLFWGLRGMLFIIGGSSYIIIYCPQLIFPSIIIMSGLTLSSKVIGGYQRLYKIDEVKHLTKTSEIAGERLSNMKLIKISHTEEQEKFTYLKSLNDFYKSSKLVNYYTALNFSVLEGFGFLSLIGILTYGSYLVTLGVASPDLVSSSIYAFYVGMGFRSVFNCYTELKKTAGQFYGIEQLIGSINGCKIYNDPTIIQNSQNLLDQYFKRIQEESKKNFGTVHQVESEPSSIEFKNVSFKYEEYGEDRDLFNNFSLNIEKGKIVAIIGSSGSGNIYKLIFKGKTSLLNLLTRLYIPSNGQIVIDGKNLNTELQQEWVQKNISYVTQEPILFMGTIQQNLIYGNQGFDLSEENLQRSAKIANCHDFIMDMPDKYDTQISERGGSLSGGQKQRLILARALVKNPKILIMDEGTANLDPETEKSIIQDLKIICENRTCILVTHKIENYRPIIDSIIDLDQLKLQQQFPQRV